MDKPDLLRDEILRRAYRLFEERGGEHGQDWKDWFQAERDVYSNFQADTIVHLGPTGLLAAAEWTLQRLRDLGVNLPSGNRLQVARALIDRVNRNQITLRPEDDPLLEDVTEAQWTIIEQYVVLRSAPRTASSLRPEHRAKLETMLSGAPTAEADANPLGRNTQFELYVGATLAMGGASVTIEEPDLVMVFVGRQVGIAAKRVRSALQLSRRVDDAVDQIRRTGRPGFVAVSVEALVKNTGAPSEVVRLDARLGALAAIDEKLRHIPEVFGSIVFGRDTTWRFEGERPRIEVGTFLRMRITPAGQAVGPRAYESLAELLARIKERQHSL